MRIKPLLRTAVFLWVLLALLEQVSSLLRGNNYAFANEDFYLQRRGAFDVIMMGSSHMLNAVAPMQLWEEHGIPAYNFAQNGQTLPVTYYQLQEALRRQSPRVIVLDVYKAIQESLTDSEASLHASLDGMPLGRAKLQTVFELVPRGERAEFLLDVIRYHSRWKELSRKDFMPRDPVEKGAQALFSHSAHPDFQAMPAYVTAPGAEPALAYLEKIAALCREERVELLLVVTPFTTAEDDDMNRQQVANAMAGWAAERGIPYLNMLHLTDEIGFDYAVDMANPSHPNWLGMEKITAWLGDYLAAHYELPDRRGESGCLDWERDLERYNAYLREESDKFFAALSG